jgi:hypothetical protein
LLRKTPIQNTTNIYEMYSQLSTFKDKRNPIDPTKPLDLRFEGYVCVPDNQNVEEKIAGKTHSTLVPIINTNIRMFIYLFQRCLEV